MNTPRSTELAECYPQISDDSAVPPLSSYEDSVVQHVSAQKELRSLMEGRRDLAAELTEVTEQLAEVRRALLPEAGREVSRAETPRLSATLLDERYKYLQLACKELDGKIGNSCSIC